MNRVRILPEILSNQIAAGEVVERPSSVVKELVENSIDAGASGITIEIIKGGKNLIRVSDDGHGLSKDDALLAIERYATSKIFTREDLFSISTMGFRGEALPSIASVSKFCMVTKTSDSDTGTKIEMSGGVLKNVSETGAPAGTMVEVKNLFFNTPARKKFLKIDQTETARLIDAVSGLALGHPQTGFRLFANSRLVKNFSSSDDLFQRAVNVLGNDVSKSLLKLDFKHDDIRIGGYCAGPFNTRSTASRIFLFVNQRLVYDRGLMSAIFQGYRQKLMKGRYPLGVFFIDINYDQVDVNVHPSKREIRFTDPRKVYHALAAAVHNALSGEQAGRKIHSRTTDISPDLFQFREKIENTAGPENSWTQTDAFVRTAAENRPEFISKPQQEYDIQEPAASYRTTKESIIPSENLAAEKKPAEDHASNLTPQTPKLKTQNSKLKTQNSKLKTQNSPLSILGQAMNTYIIVESEDALTFIDQHAAHERIVYETLKKRYKTLDVQSQELVIPETVELSFAEADQLSEILDDLEKLGMKIEPFGETTFVVRSVPALIDEKEIKPVIVEILEAFLDDRDGSKKEAWLDRCLILMACHSSVRANQTLKEPEIRKLLADLEQCANPGHCPHGRPVSVSWTKTQMEKLFRRI